MRKKLQQEVRNVIHDEMSHFLRDIEWRLEQVYAVANRDPERSPTVYAEDQNLLQHQITGYTMTSNSPTAGNIAWASVHIVYAGVNYTIADGNTATGGPFKYVYFVKPGSYTPPTPVTLTMSNTMPTLALGDCMVFINNSGVPTSALEQISLPGAVATGAVIDGSISGTVSGSKIGSGISATNVTTGTLTGSLVGTGINATNITSGTLTGSLVGTGVSATNVTTGTLSGSLVGTGVSATNITTGTLTGSLVGTGISATNVTTGTLDAARVGAGVDGADLTSATGAVVTTQINTYAHLIF